MERDCSEDNRSRQRHRRSALGWKCVDDGGCQTDSPTGIGKPLIRSHEVDRVVFDTSNLLDRIDRRKDGTWNDRGLNDFEPMHFGPQGVPSHSHFDAFEPDQTTERGVLLPHQHSAVY